MQISYLDFREGMHSKLRQTDGLIEEAPQSTAKCAEEKADLIRRLFPTPLVRVETFYAMRPPLSR
jgi:hypothetical protein